MPAVSPPIQIRPTRILLFSVFLLVNYSTATCPTLPSGCKCTEDTSRRPSVTCHSVPSEIVLSSLQGQSVDVLQLRNSSANIFDTPFQLTALRVLEIVDSGITNVKATSLSSIAASLMEIDLSSNRLTTIPLLPSFPKLARLSLTGNQISDIPEGVFDGLPALRILQLGSNSICAMSSNALNETKDKLERLDLSSNCLSAVPAQTLRNSRQLIFLDISTNRISEIGNFNLMNLPSLRQLNINDNLINRIHSMAFMNVPQLQLLYMRNNLIANLDGNRLQAFPKLEILDISNNMLSQLPSFKDLPQLKQVRLDGNLIAQVETLAFSSNPRLQLVSLQDNTISVVARNSFDSLDQLVTLLLANNSIKAIERGTFDGMKNLQQLNLRNNSITEVDVNSFSPLRQLTALDLGSNQLKKIGKGAFDPLKKLYWLDLTGNRLRSVEKGTFSRRIPNILLDGNPLECDEKLDWFITWLVAQKIRTFLPAQPEIECAGPVNMKGVRLKELMINKANETRTIELNKPKPDRNILNKLLPVLSSVPGMGPPQSAIGGLAGIPGLNSLASAIPGLRNMPGVRQSAAVHDRFINPASPQQMAAPRLSGLSTQADLEQLLQSMPNMNINVPGYGNLDVSKLPPSLIAHVLRGGQIPGVPKETLDSIMQTYMAKLSEMAASAQKTVPSSPAQGHMPHPTELMTSPLSGGQSVSRSDESQASLSKQYQQLSNGAMPSGTNIPALSISPQAIEMMKLLPPGYNVSLIPVEVMNAISHGEVPDLTLLPEDLQEHLKANSDKMLSMFSRNGDNTVTIDQLLAKLPRWERPVLPTFSPYDINDIHNELVQEEEAGRAKELRMYSAIALSGVALVSIAIIVCMCIYNRRNRSDIIHSSPSSRPFTSESSQHV